MSVSKSEEAFPYKPGHVEGVNPPRLEDIPDEPEGPSRGTRREPCVSFFVPTTPNGGGSLIDAPTALIAVDTIPLNGTSFERQHAPHGVSWHQVYRHRLPLIMARVRTARAQQVIDDATETYTAHWESRVRDMMRRGGLSREEAERMCLRELDPAYSSPMAIIAANPAHAKLSLGSFRWVAYIEDMPAPRTDEVAKREQREALTSAVVSSNASIAAAIADGNASLAAVIGRAIGEALAAQDSHRKSAKS